MDEDKEPMPGAPERIYLVVGEYIEEGDDFNNLDEVCWCADSQFDTDIVYVRADVVAALEAERDALRAEREVLRNAMEQLAAVPGCGCAFPCRCGGAEWTRAELEGRMDVAAEALRAIASGAQS